MRILVDTNILIHLEDNKILESEFSLLYSTAINNNCTIFYHRACLDDLSKDKNEERRRIVISKLNKYTPLGHPAQLSDEISIEFGEKNDNDRIDNEQLLQLKKGYVELFITNDKGILKKAKKLNLQENVLDAKSASLFLEKQYRLSIPSHPVLDHVSVRELESEFNNDFFNSLKNDYDPEKFMKWIDKCAREDRKCYTLKIENNLAALLIYNEEMASEHDLAGINVTAIKICTLKVGDDALGMKLGELFLNKMFQLSRIKKIDYLYVTTYPKQTALIYLLQKFGFDKHQEFTNSINQTETIYLKTLRPSDQKSKTGNKLHPYFRDGTNKYVVPIQPKYYKSLFKDGNLRTPSLFDNEDYGLEEVQGNTIIKAYISNSTRQDLVEGDLLFFYSSQKHKSIEPLGILIEHKRVNNFPELWEMVRSKTVYSPENLENWLRERKYLTVTTFRLVQYLSPIINFEKIKELESFSSKFQTITKLTENDYNIIKNIYIDESFIVD